MFVEILPEGCVDFIFHARETGTKTIKGSFRMLAETKHSTIVMDCLRRKVCRHISVKPSNLQLLSIQNHLNHLVQKN